ncbi:hypothetical protein HG535_0F02680 [Zygotorulaspora mrakii]|uniref:Dolichyl-diphosphooligosaccharide--protein glycosyltransferase subunit WBP1 n=1 Tax=Zygotorulaspora mrakii TaxID=42260 RepID=A0A7H9B5F9_ZYGMR|nr:uncharacterized protein HG535_0F02680 [Zygotorulaspora mrakii]QLG73757.1 hypothetical protein HG535_0F02680 [Zygotorulaspora mrakii]
MLSIFTILCLSLCFFSNALSIHGSKTLVVFDDRLTQLDEFSYLFDSLKERSYELEYLSVANDSGEIELYDGETPLYNNLMIFPIKGKVLNRKLTVDSLLNFYNNDGNIFVITSPDGVAEPARMFLNELGIYPSPKDHVVVDYFQEVPSSLVISTSGIESKDIFEDIVNDSIIIENSSAALLDNRDQIIPFIAAPRTSFTEGKGKESWTTGSQGFLAAGFQSLKNSRVAWIGSDEFLKNENQNSNGKFIQGVVKWNFKEKNVIKITESVHSHADGTPYELLPYKIKDSVRYDVGISEWDGEKWVPFLATDLQFELKMIDPYYRLPLIPLNVDESTQYYSTGNFSLPDHHGVFTFQIDYKRPGFSFISTSDVKAVRHLAHDEYLRSWDITNSRVYLTTVFVLIFVWVLFVIFFISTTPVNKTMEIHKKTN